MYNAWHHNRLLKNKEGELGSQAWDLSHPKAAWGEGRASPSVGESRA